METQRFGLNQTMRRLPASIKILQKVCRRRNERDVFILVQNIFEIHAYFFIIQMFMNSLMLLFLLLLSEEEREKDRQKARAVICWSITQMPVMVRVEPG